MNDSKFIKALYYGKEHPNGFTISKLENHLKTSYANWGPLKREFIGQRPEHAFNQDGSEEGEDLYWLTKSGHQLLAQLDDVRQARKEARRAQRIAVCSICVAAVPILIELYKNWF